MLKRVLKNCPLKKPALKYLKEEDQFPPN